jgi:hypothetical protein
MCTKICIEMVCLLLWPVIFLVMLVIAYLAININVFINFYMKTKCLSNNICYTLGQIIILIFVLLLLLSLGLLVVILSYTLLVIPMWIGIAYILARKNLNWLPYRHYFNTPIKKPLPNTFNI